MYFFFCFSVFFFFKQKTAYEVRISDWSSDVCSSDLRAAEYEHRNAHRGADDGEEVVLFEHMIVRFVMVAVTGPAEAVHDIFMARPGDAFHREDGGDNKREIGRAHV